MIKYLTCQSDLLWWLLLFIQQQERTRNWKTEDSVTANNGDSRLHPLWVVAVLGLPSLTQGSLFPITSGRCFRTLLRRPSLIYETWHSKVVPFRQSCSGSYLLKLEGLLETTALHKSVQSANSCASPPGNALTLASYSNTGTASCQPSWGTWKASLCSGQRGRFPGAERCSQIPRE